MGGGSRGGRQVLGHLPIFELSHQVVHRLWMVVGQDSPGLGWQLPHGVVNDHTIDWAGSLSGGQPSLDQPAVLGDLSVDGPSGLEPPFMKALGSGGEVMFIVGEYGLLECAVLACCFGSEILAGLLGGSC